MKVQDYHAGTDFTDNADLNKHMSNTNNGKDKQSAVSDLLSRTWTLSYTLQKLNCCFYLAPYEQDMDAQLYLYECSLYELYPVFLEGRSLGTRLVNCLVTTVCDPANLKNAVVVIILSGGAGDYY